MVRHLGAGTKCGGVFASATSTHFGEQEQASVYSGLVGSWGVLQQWTGRNLCIMTNADNTTAYVVARWWIIRYKNHDNG